MRTMKLFLCLMLLNSIAYSGEGWVPSPDELAAWQKELDDAKKSLTFSDLELLKDAKLKRSRHDRQQQIGYDAAKWEESWEDEGRKQFDIYQLKLAGVRGDLARPRKWIDIDPVDRIPWIHLAKLNASGLMSWNGSKKLQGLVEGDEFVVSGRFYEIHKFSAAVRFIREHGTDQSSFSTILYLKNLSDDLSNQSEKQSSRGPTDDSKTLRRSWRIKGDLEWESLKTKFAINDVIQLWPLEIDIIESNGIKAKSK